MRLIGNVAAALAGQLDLRDGRPPPAARQPRGEKRTDELSTLLAKVEINQDALAAA